MGLGSSIYKLTFDSNAQTAIAPTRREVALLNKIMAESTPAAKKYEDSVAALTRMFARSEMTAKQFTHAMRALEAERPENIRRAEQEARAEKLRADALRRGAQVTREMETATERYQREMADLERQIRRGGPHVEAYRRKLAQLKAEFAGTSVKANSFASTLGSVSRFAGPIAALTGVSVGVGGIGMAARSAGRSYSEFATSMAHSTAIMGDLSEDTLERMRQVARDVSYDVEASASQAADGYFYLASAGLTAEESIAALPITSKFAQAGTFDLATATDLLTDAQSALGMNVGTTTERMEKMTKVGDVLTKANTIANASIEQFSTALTTKAGAALRAVNKDIEEGVSVLSVFADQGLKGAEAGTALSIVMRDLQTKAIKNADAFAANDIAVFDAAGSFRNIADVMADLESRMEGLSVQAQKELLIDLGFADKSLAFTQLLIGTSEQIREYERDLRHASGTMDEVAGKSMSDLGEVLNVVRAGWDEFSAAVAEPLFNGMMGTDGESLEDSIREFNAHLVDAGPLLHDVGQGIGSVAAAAGQAAESFGPLADGLSTINSQVERLTGSGIVEFWGRNTAAVTKLAGWIGTGGVLGSGFRYLAGDAEMAVEPIEETADAIEKVAKSSEHASAAVDAIREMDMAESLAAESADALTTQIERLEKSLQDEISTLIMGEEAYERFRLKTSGATDEHLAFYDQLRHQRNALLAKAEAEKEAARTTEEAADATEAALGKEARAYEDLSRSSFSAMVAGSDRAESFMAAARRDAAGPAGERAHAAFMDTVFPAPGGMSHPVAMAPGEDDKKLGEAVKVLKKIERKPAVMVREVTL